MTLRLSEADDRLSSERARSEGRSKQDVAQEAIRIYLTDQVRRVEDLEDEPAVARYQLRRQLGEVTYVSQAEARSSLGLPPAQPRSASGVLRLRVGRYRVLYEIDGTSIRIDVLHPGRSS